MDSRRARINGTIRWTKEAFFFFLILGGSFFLRFSLWSGKSSVRRSFFFFKKLLERKVHLKISNLKLSPDPGILVKDVIK